MSARTGDRVAIALGLTSAFIGVVTMGVEQLTDRALASALGVPTFMATPLGVASLAFVPIVARIGRTFAGRQALAALVFWVLWAYWSFS